MATTIANAHRYAFLVVLLAACDPVRPGNYQGDFPPPQSVNLTSISAQSDCAFFSLEVFIVRSPRRWTLTGGGRNDDSFCFRLDGQTRMQVAVWPGLASAMQDVTYLDDLFRQPDTVAFGTLSLNTTELQAGPSGSAQTVSGPTMVAAGSNHLLVASVTDMDVQPMGPGGPTLSVRRGFQMFRRTCSAENLNQFESVPLDTTVEMTPVPAVPAYTTTDAAYVTACGLKLMPPDLGQRVPVSSYGPVKAMAWGPPADTLYFVAGGNDAQGDTVGTLDTTNLAFATVAMGYYGGPLRVATGGTTLLLNQIIDPQSGMRAQHIQQPIRLSLQPGTGPVISPLGETAFSPSLLSPDGTTLAYSGSVEDPDGTSHSAVVLRDLAKGSTRALPYDGQPLAWSPDGQALLIDSSVGIPHGTTTWTRQLVPTDGSIAGPTVEGLPATLTWQQETSWEPVVQPYPRQHFWGASGPYVVIQDGQGVQVHDLVTLQTIEVVEPSRVTLVGTPFAVVASTDQVFAWAIQCFGIGETSCNAELRRMSLATGARDVVATANQALLFAVSPDGKTLAVATDAVVATDTNIYIKPLAP